MRVNLALMHSSDREWSPRAGAGGAHSAVFFLAAPARAMSSFFLVRRLFSFVCAPSRFLIAAAAARVGSDQASHQHRRGRLAQPEPHVR